MEFTAKLHQPTGLLWGRHIIVPEKIAEYYIKTLKTRRVLLTINDTLTVHCALMPDGNGQFFININGDNCKKLKIDSGQTIQLNLAEDDSQYGIYCCEEFKELLEFDLEGNDYFQRLKDGKKRTLIYTISKPKSEAKRIEKGLIILDYLKDNNGKLNFTDMQLALKTNKRYRI
jgi:hypothetical protein